MNTSDELLAVRAAELYYDEGRTQDEIGAVLYITRWMVGRLAATIKAVDQAMSAYRFNDAANALYHCVWGEFCDWYLEFTKPILQGNDEAAKAETRATTAWVLGQLLHLLHPFMPFLTEELWEQVGLAGSGRLISADWPSISEAAIDTEATADLDWVIRVVSEVRALRTEMNVPPAAQVELIIRDAAPKTAARLEKYNDLICRLARAASATLLAGEAPKGAAQIVIDEATVLLPLGVTLGAITTFSTSVEPQNGQTTSVRVL